MDIGVEHSTKKNAGIKELIIGLIIIFLISITSLYGYLLFHVTSELFSVIVAAGIFIVAWHSRKVIGNNYLMLIGIAYLFIGSLDLAHTLAYKGMRVFKGQDYNLAPAIWIATRYMESLTLLIAPFLFRKKLNYVLVFFIYFGITAFILTSIFYWKIFPIAFVEGVGLTPFKKISEYIISAFLLIAIYLLYKKRKNLDSHVYKLILWSIIFTILSELAFTVYTDLYAVINRIGHVFKIISFYLIYKAIISTGLVKPYDIIFRELKQNEKLLKDTNNELKQLVEMKNKFISIASHDLRAPFNSILGFSEILINDEELDEKYKDYIKMIKQSANIQLQNINNILQVVKLEKGNLTINKKKTQIAELINTSISTLKVLADKKGIELSYVKQCKVCDKYVKVDFPKMIQVINNLIYNAIKFTETNGKIKLDCKTTADNNVEVHVIDNGIGIEKEKLQYLFKQETSYGEGTKGEEGTGLGLLICKNIIELHEGEIGVKSEVNKGSDFYFILPLI